MTRVSQGTHEGMKEAAYKINRVLSALACCGELEDELKKYSLILLTNTYLVVTHAYYDRDESLLPSGVYDTLRTFLLENFERLKAAGVWWVGEQITEESLLAGTCLGVSHHPPIKTIADIIIGKRSFK